MEYYLNYIRGTYFTNPLSLIVAIVALVISIKYSKQNQSFRLLPYYLLGYILVLIGNVFGSLLLDKKYEVQSMTLQTAVDFLFTVCEYFIFSRFISKFLTSKTHSRVIQGLSITFVVVSISIATKSIMTFGYIKANDLQNIFIIQALLLLPQTVFYFINLLSIPQDFEFRLRYDFWIITGLCFTMVCSLPFSFICNYLRDYNYEAYNSLYSIFYILYIIFFCMIIKGLSCLRIQAR
jgi:hypothetical protein